MKGTQNRTEASLKRFDDHRCLSQSEESKYFWLRKTSVFVGTLQWNFRVLCVPFIRRSLHFLGVSSFFPYFCLIHTSVLSLSTWILKSFLKCKDGIKRIQRTETPCRYYNAISNMIDRAWICFLLFLATVVSKKSIDDREIDREIGPKISARVPFPIGFFFNRSNFLKIKLKFHFYCQ